jgi:hypothetical protein
MSWTDGRPFVATRAHCNMKWDCSGPGVRFRCSLCGYKFAVGDTVRWQFTNDTRGAGGNPFVCKACDTGRDSIIAEIIKRREELRADRWWWFLPRQR